MGEQSVDFVKGVYGAVARGDVPAVLGAFAEDIEWFEAEGMPYGERELPCRRSRCGRRGSFTLPARSEGG
jgi:ketosteroid isomerase-like protein